MKRVLMLGFLTLAFFPFEQGLAAIFPSATIPPIRVNNTAKYSSGRYTWTVFLLADESILKNVDYVEYTLHPSFPNPVQYVKERGTKCAFPLTSSSWGEFEVKVKVAFKDGSETYLKYW